VDLGRASFTELGNLHVAPEVVDLAGGDLRPSGGSALVDRVKDLASTGQIFDIEGKPVADGDGDGEPFADAGAFEYQRRPPQIDSLDVPASGATGAALSFGAATSDPDGDPVNVKWEFGEGAPGSGSQTSHAYASPGTYQVRVTATDSAGVSVSREATVSVTAGSAAGTGAGGGGAASGGAGGAGGDAVAPVLSSVRLSTKTTSVRRAGGLRLRFKVSEAAKLRIVPTRLVGSRKVAARGAIVRQAKPERATSRAAKRSPVKRASTTGAGGSYLKLAVVGGLRMAAALVTALWQPPRRWARSLRPFRRCMCLGSPRRRRLVDRLLHGLLRKAFDVRFCQLSARRAAQQHLQDHEQEHQPAGGDLPASSARAGGSQASKARVPRAPVLQRPWQARLASPEPA
jgi:PKD repeat protein